VISAVKKAGEEGKRVPKLPFWKGEAEAGRGGKPWIRDALTGDPDRNTRAEPKNATKLAR